MVKALLNICAQLAKVSGMLENVGFELEAKMAADIWMDLKLSELAL